MRSRPSSSSATSSSTSSSALKRRVPRPLTRGSCDDGSSSMTFRTRSFITALGTAAVTLIVAVVLGSWNVRRTVGERIERSLVNEARLAAETLSHRQPATPEELDAEADALGRIVSARVTFIAPDGRVVGDSRRVERGSCVTVENHSDRPEIQQARQRRSWSRAPLQRDARHRHAVRRGAGAQSGRADAQRGAARGAARGDPRSSSRRCGERRSSRPARDWARRCSAGVGWRRRS